MSSMSNHGSVVAVLERGTPPVPAVHPGRTSATTSTLKPARPELDKLVTPGDGLRFVDTLLQLHPIPREIWATVTGSREHRGALLLALASQVPNWHRVKIAVALHSRADSPVVEQELLLALNSLLDSFKPEKGRLLAYIIANLQARSHDTRRAEARESRRLYAWRQRIARAEESIQQRSPELGSVVHSDIASYLGVAPPVLDSVVHELRIARPLIEADQESTLFAHESQSLLESIADGRSSPISLDSPEVVQGLLAGVSSRYRGMVRDHLVEGKLLRVIGDELSLTESRIAQIVRENKQLVQNSYMARLPPAIQEISRIALVGGLEASTIAEAYRISDARVGRILQNVLSLTVESDSEPDRLFRDRDQEDFVIQALQRNPALKIRDVLRVHGVFPDLDKVTKDQLRKAIANLLGVKNQVAQVARALVEQGYLAPVPESWAGRMISRISNYVRPDILGVKATSNLAAYIQASYPDLDSLPPRHMALYAALNVPLEQRTKVAMAAACVQQGILSADIPAGHRVGIDRKNYTLYFNARVVGSEEQVRKNIVAYIRNSYKDLDDFRVTVRGRAIDGLCYALSIPRSVRALARFCVEAGIFPPQVPSGHALVMHQRLTHYIMPDVVGAAQAEENLKALLQQSFSSIEELPLMKPLCRFFGLRQSVSDLARYIVKKGWLSSAAPMTKPSP